MILGSNGPLPMKTINGDKINQCKEENFDSLNLNTVFKSLTIKLKSIIE